MSYQIGNAQLGVTFVGDLGSLQRSLDQAGGSVDQFGRRSTTALRGVGAEAGRADDAMSRLANGIKGAFIGGSVAVGLIGLKNQVVAATGAIIDAQVQLDRWRNGFAFGAGGMAQGAQEFAFVREEVNRLGLDLGSTAGQYMKMVAASRGSSLAGAQTREVFKSIAEASVVMGMNADQNERAMMAVTQMMSKGKVMAEELRGQLGEHLPGAFSIAARAMGVTEVELNKLMETGQVFSTDFLPKFAAQLRKELAGSVEQSSLSMQANLNRLETTWLNFKQQFAQSGAGDALSGGIKVLSGDLKVLGDVMEASRQRGEGFWMTMANTTGAVVGRAAFGLLELAANTANGAVFGLREQVRLMPDNLRSTAEQFVLTGQKIQQAQAEYDTLALRLAQAPDNIYIKSELGNLARYITRLKEAQDEQRRLMGLADPGNESGAEAARLNRQNTAAGEAIARRAAQATARDALLKRYASPAEKLTEELKTQRDLLGDLFTPEIEQRIRANFIKPAREGGSAVRTAADEYQRLSDRLATELAAGAAQAQAAQQGLNSAQVDFLKLAASPVWAGLTEQQRAQVAVLFEQRIAQEQLADSLKATTAAVEALARAEDDRIKTYTDSAGKATDRLAELRAEAEAMAYAEANHVSLAVAIEHTAMARLREAQAAEMAKGAGMNDSIVLALQQEIEARRQIVDAIAGREVREASQRLREDQAAEWQRTWDQVSQSFTDALMDGGKSVAQYLKSLFRTLVLRPILAPVGAAMASIMAPSTASAAASAAASGGTGGLGGAGGVLGSIGQLGGLASAFGTGMAASFSSMMSAGISGWASAAGSLIGSGAASGIAAGLGMIAAPIAAAAVLWKPLFGRKAPVTTSQGISGTFSEQGASVQGYEDWFAKGGLFRSNKSGTNYSAVSTELDQFLDAALGQVGAATRAYAGLMSLNADAINGISQTVKINLKDLNEQQQQEAIAKAIGGFGDRLAQELLGTFETTVTQRRAMFGRIIETSVTEWVAGPFVRAGETAGEALARLGQALGVTNQIFDTLGTTVFAASLQGADYASRLADVFGGLETLQSATLTYYQAYYSESERLATGTRQMTTALAALGLQLPDSRAGFRALVEAQDLTTDAGRSTYAALMGLAPAFAELTQAMEQMGASLQKEVQRLRGLLTSDSSTSLAALQAQFATGTAMARAGDAEALARLPELSQAIEAAAALQARTAVDVALMRGQLAASLSETLSVLGLKVPAFEVGTNYVPRTMLAQVHEGEAIVPKAYNPAAGGTAAGSDDLARRVDALVAELQGLRAEVRSGVTHSAKTARILDRVARDGNAFVTVAEA